MRQRRYLVEETVPPPEPGDATLVRLACVDDDAQGQLLDVLWECEVDPEILHGEAWSHLGSKGFDDPRRFAAYIHALRWNAVTAADPRLFQSPFRAGIRLDAYQLEPLRKALLLPRVNLFIADDADGCLVFSRFSFPQLGYLTGCKALPLEGSLPASVTTYRCVIVVAAEGQPSPGDGFVVRGDVAGRLVLSSAACEPR